MKTLVVGDVHAQSESLKDCQALHELIVKTIERHCPAIDNVLFLGDQYNTHAIVNVEVQAWWIKAFSELKVPVIALVGNHDKPGDASAKSTAMQVHTNILVVDKPTVQNGILYIPYYHDQEAFIAASQAHPECQTLVCHQSLDGAAYDNGFFIRGAPSPEQLAQKYIISGHIHKPTRFANVFYPGSPRAQTISDANIERAIWVVNFEDGGPTSKIAIPTTPYLKAIWQLEDCPEQDKAENQSIIEKTKFGDVIVINLHGPKGWCESRRNELATLRSGMRFRSFVTDGRQSSVKESDGLAVAFQKHLKAYRAKFSTSTDTLSKMAQERVTL